MHRSELSMLTNLKEFPCLIFKNLVTRLAEKFETNCPLCFPFGTELNQDKQVWVRLKIEFATTVQVRSVNLAIKGITTRQVRSTPIQRKSV